MLSERHTMVAINVVGGLAVLGSYAYCLTTYPERVGEFWGGVPDALRPVYTINMFLAAAGYFAFTFFIMVRMKPEVAGFSLSRFTALYSSILVPSAMWMPLTFAMLIAPSETLWWTIRLTLAIVGIGSVGLLAALVLVRPKPGSLSHKLAVVGAIAFCMQTAVLDALVWPAFFPS